MSVRVWISRVTGSGTTLDPYRGKAMQYCHPAVSFFPSNSDGTPASDWVLVIGKSEDWTAAEADSDLVDLFDGDIPPGLENSTALKQYLKNRPILAVPPSKRQNIENSLDSIGIDRTDFSANTTMWDVFRRVSSTLFSKGRRGISREVFEMSPGFGEGFYFP